MASNFLHPHFAAANRGFGGTIAGYPQLDIGADSSGMSDPDSIHQYPYSLDEWEDITEETIDPIDAQSVEYPHENGNAWTGGDLELNDDLETGEHPREILSVWKWRAMVIANCFLTVMHGYDVSNVANIQASVYKAFGHIELLSWVALAYSICNVALIPLGRQLFKIGNFKTLCLISMLFIIGGSALSGAAFTIECIIAGRAMMALGTSVIYQGIISFCMIYTYPRELALVQSVLGACFAIGLVLGPIIGGAFADNEQTTWRWAFYMVIPLCAFSLLLQVFFYPRYRMPTNKSVWTQVKEIDWVGVFLHITCCLLFAVSCTFLGSVDVWGTTSAISTWIIFTFVLIAYSFQQGCSICTTPENRILSAGSLFANGTVHLTWICTFCAAASYGVTLYYLPIYFAFRFGLSPLLAASRLLPFIGVFIFTIVLCGALLPAVRVYKPFFLAGSTLLLVGGGLFQTLDTTTSEAAVMGFETIVAAGLGVLWQLAVPVCTTFIRDTEERLDLAMLSNLAQLGGIASSLSIAGMIYQSTGFQALLDSVGSMNFSGADIRQLLAGTDSSIITGNDPKVLSLALEAVTTAIRGCFIIILAAGGIAFIAAWSMKWEALEFKASARQQQSGDTGNNQLRHQRSADEFLLEELTIRRETTHSEAVPHISRVSHISHISRSPHTTVRVRG